MNDGTATEPTVQQWGRGVHLDSFLHCISVKYRRKLGVLGGIQGEVYHRFSGEDDFWAGPWEIVRIYSFFLGNAKRFGHILAAEKLFFSPVWHEGIVLPLALAWVCDCSPHHIRCVPRMTLGAWLDNDKGPYTFACPGTKLPALDWQLLLFFAPFHDAVTWLWFAVGIWSTGVFCTWISFSGRRFNQGAALIIWHTPCSRGCFCVQCICLQL